MVVYTSIKMQEGEVDSLARLFVRSRRACIGVETLARGRRIMYSLVCIQEDRNNAMNATVTQDAQ